MVEARIGVGVIIIKDDKVLLGKRQGSHGSGTWSFPGGHLEFGETPEETALREVDEECGIIISNLRRGPYTNDIFEKENKQYVTLFILADYVSGSAEIKEPDKCLGWEWVSWDYLAKRELFIPIKNLLQEDYNPFN